MTLGSIFDNENDILAQNREIGVPSVEELQNSPNAVWIEAYTRDDGTEVRGHWRSLPEGASTLDEIFNNNLNKYNINSNDNQLNKLENTQTLAGVVPGEPMSYQEAGGKNVNPNYELEDFNYKKIVKIQ